MDNCLRHQKEELETYSTKEEIIKEILKKYIILLIWNTKMSLIYTLKEFDSFLYKIK